MAHDVTMPQLGMAQDAGKIVSWLKAPGDAVAAGEALFEVETDKAVMEVEAPAAGYLSAVAFGDGAEVPVGAVIARIVATAEEVEAAAPAPEAQGAPAPEAHGKSAPEAQGEPAPEAPGAGAAGGAAALPDGHPVTMPQLGMAQDAGVLVSWLKAPGDRVAAEDVLFEVETDKSTMEVEAGRAGWLAATLARAGEEVPVGEAVAILSEAEPAVPVARSVRDGAAPTAAATTKAPAAEATAKAPATAHSPQTAQPAPATESAAPVAPHARGGRILASPKARRLAAEEGLDLARLAEAGHPQPYHVADLAVLRAMPTAPAAAGAPALPPRRLTASVATDGLAAFAAWAAAAEGLSSDAVLAGLVGASLGADDAVTVAVARMGAARGFTVPPGRALSAVAAADSDAPPALVVRDLRGTPLVAVAMGAEPAPVLTIMEAGMGAGAGGGLSITLECGAEALDADAAIGLLAAVAGRLDDPLRHLL
ncbi:biotin/lipoyl-containing protein [Rhodosalinus sp.]|uniref:biotin/lipoyl-containing protein n=1 Tax=Rhodosalinus sp. TaxID=2047741 RepID=UPI00356B25DA